MSIVAAWPPEPGPALVDVAGVAGLRRAGARTRGPATPAPMTATLTRRFGVAPLDPGQRGRRALLGVEVLRARDHVQRPLLDLVVDPPEVLAEHAEREQLDAADQQHREQQRRHAALVDAGVAGDDRQRQPEQRERRAREAGQRGELQREVRERRQPVEREAQHLAQRVLRLAGGARVAVVLDDSRARSRPTSSSRAGSASARAAAAARRAARGRGAGSRRRWARGRPAPAGR